MKELNKITIQHWDFPQICFEMTQEELLKELEDNNKPKWWLDKYRKQILEGKVE